jgi:ribonucleoside-diphosphate reductase alpha chain
MLPTLYQDFIYLRTYSRWREDLKRREVWSESVRRYFSFWENKFPFLIGTPEWKEAEEAVLGLEDMPSMRSLAAAGPALDRDNVAGYNCAYVAVDSPRAFDEAMYILMCGTGVGFSVERQYIAELPVIAESFHDSDTIIAVADSKIGWAKSLRELISMLYAGQVPKWDVSKVRPAGAKLKTFGGRASGPEPLVKLFKFTVELFKRAAGRKLNSIECHDLMCKIAEIVVVGGVRRSAMISLSNLTDERMRMAKSGQWWVDNPQRALANNSVCYTEKPDIGIFMREWESLYESKSGERGIYNREAALKTIPERRKESGYKDYGCNPCSEINLRSKQFCNLSEVIVRPTDTFEDLKRKVKIATILGTLQATLTDFRYLSKEWEKNTKEEALLGVSFTGIMDHPVMSGRTEYPFKPNSNSELLWDNFTEGWELLYSWPLDNVLNQLRDYAIEVNREWASRLGINPASAITCVKPSGTVSQLVDSSSGIHPRFSEYYIRRVRADKKDPLSQLMIDQGVPVEEDKFNPSTWVFSFPMKAPEGAITNKDVTAIGQLELWKLYQEHWTEHKPSITVFYKDDEFLEVGAWVYKNFDTISGVSFLPHTDHTYEQAPYEAMSAKMPKEIDWSKLSEYEKEDTTTSSKEFACTGNSCELN